MKIEKVMYVLGEQQKDQWNIRRVNKEKQEFYNTFLSDQDFTSIENLHMLKQQSISLKVKKKGKFVAQENHYQKIKLIGQGTFGKVYLAKKDNQLYAIKEVLQDPRYKNRQLGIISRIDHQNIIFMIDYYIKISNQDHYLNVVMDFLPTSLNLMIKELRKDKAPIAPQIRKLLIFQLFKALYYMQLNNICHRDLKPPNILINDETYELKICDFGSAKILQKKQKNVAYIVSRYYRAPELIMGSSAYSTQIDIWSAGCIIVQLLTLQPIFPGDSSVEQLIQIIKILGTPPDKLIKTYEQVNLSSLPLPKIKQTSWTKILKKYNSEPQLIDLIDKILTYDTQKRLKPYEVLIHPYFHDLHNLQNLTKNLPKLFSFSSLNNKRNKNEIANLDKIYGKKEELRLKKSNSKLTLEMVSKAETLPSTTSPEDERMNTSQISVEGKMQEYANMEKKFQEKTFSCEQDKQNRSMRKSVPKLIERKISRQASQRKQSHKEVS